MHLCITHEKIVHFKVIKSIENVKYLRYGSTVSSDKVKPEKHQKTSEMHINSRGDRFKKIICKKKKVAPTGLEPAKFDFKVSDSTDCARLGVLISRS